MVGLTVGVSRVFAYPDVLHLSPLLQLFGSSRPALHPGPPPTPPARSTSAPRDKRLQFPVFRPGWNIWKQCIIERV